MSIVLENNRLLLLFGWSLDLPAARHDDNYWVLVHDILKKTLSHAETQGIIQENQAICWNPSIIGARTEDGFIATWRGPLFITAPVIFPKLMLMVNDQALVRPGMLIID